MAKVSMLFRIMPEDLSEKIGNIREKIESKSEEIGFEVIDTKIEDIAYGLRALHVLITVKEEGGHMEKVEKALSSIENVGSFEVLEVTRL